MDSSTIQLFQRVRLLRDQDLSIGQEGWTGTVMDYQAGADHAQVEIDPRFAPQTFLGVALADLELLSLESSS